MRTPAKKLRSDFVDSNPVSFDFNDRCDWEFFSAVTCAECKHTYVTEYYESYCPKCDNTNYDDGPLYNYIYPINFRVVGGEEKAALAIKNTGLLIIKTGDEYYMALGGAGMNMSWEICEAYMLLGFLPPTHFAKLPDLAGLRKNARVKWILAGVRRSLRLSRLWLASSLYHVNHLSAHMES
jgi:hypothetical protein